jgi:hypothetical protein
MTAQGYPISQEVLTMIMEQWWNDDFQGKTKQTQ